MQKNEIFKSRSGLPNAFFFSSYIGPPVNCQPSHWRKGSSSDSKKIQFEKVNRKYMQERQEQKTENHKISTFFILFSNFFIIILRAFKQTHEAFKLFSCFSKMTKIRLQKVLQPYLTYFYFFIRHKYLHSGVPKMIVGDLKIIQGKWK